MPAPPDPSREARELGKLDGGRGSATPGAARLQGSVMWGVEC